MTRPDLCQAELGDLQRLAGLESLDPGPEPLRLFQMLLDLLGLRPRLRLQQGDVVLAVLRASGGALVRSSACRLQQLPRVAEAAAATPAWTSA